MDHTNFKTTQNKSSSKPQPQSHYFSLIQFIK